MNPIKKISARPQNDKYEKKKKIARKYPLQDGDKLLKRTHIQP